jgi:hypothetical protein
MEKHCNIEIAAQVSRVASSENSMHSNFKHRSDLGVFFVSFVTFNCKLKDFSIFW